MAVPPSSRTHVNDNVRWLPYLRIINYCYYCCVMLLILFFTLLTIDCRLYITGNVPIVTQCNTIHKDNVDCFSIVVLFAHCPIMKASESTRVCILE